MIVSDGGPRVPTDVGCNCRAGRLIWKASSDLLPVRMGPGASTLRFQRRERTFDPLNLAMKSSPHNKVEVPCRAIISSLSKLLHLEKKKENVSDNVQSIQVVHASQSSNSRLETTCVPHLTEDEEKKVHDAANMAPEFQQSLIEMYL